MFPSQHEPKPDPFEQRRTGGIDRIAAIDGT